ncbi:MAG: RNA pseudouridine synthase [Bacilli bacterium]|nr:RNA pseudouridine synthase [Bacilli bacterium]
MAKDKLDIIYEDRTMIAVNKPAHLLTIATQDEKFNTLYHKVYEYEKKKNKNNKIFIVHRLDKDTSGIVLFAKSQKLKESLQANWNTLAKKREYIAIVEGKLENDKGRIKEYLTETKSLLTIKTSEAKGKLAITDYEVLRKEKNFSVLKINIKTGRKNQIRVAMQGINHPIIGDKKYGSKKNPLRRICLHASRLVITNPLTNQDMEFNAKYPQEFKIFNEKSNKDDAR